MVKRSGGFAGISTTSKIDTKDLPPKILNIVNEIMTNPRSPTLLNRVTQKGAADHYQYVIEVKNGTSTKTIKCNQYNVQDDLKSLIEYIEQFNRKKI